MWSLCEKELNLIVILDGKSVYSNANFSFSVVSFTNVYLKDSVTILISHI